MAKKQTPQPETEGTELALFPKLNLPSVTGITEEMNATFKTMFTRIEEDIAHLPDDMSDPKNRERVASFAYRISRTKTGLDAAAAGVASEAKQIVESVNAERRTLKETLDSLRDKARAKLTAWEQAEEARKIRVRDISMRLNNIEIELVGLSSAQLAEKWQEIDALGIPGPEYGEDAIVIQKLMEQALDTINDETRNAEIREAEAEELAQLRREKAEREAAEAARIAEEESKAAEAAEVARQEAERARLAQEAEEKAKREAAEAIQRAEDEKAEAQRRAEEAEKREKQRIEDDKRREIEQEEARAAAAARAEEDAKRREEEAREAERQRIANEARAKEKADQERAADLAHRKKINAAAVDALLKATDLTEKQAQAVVIAIYKDQIPAITINY